MKSITAGILGGIAGASNQYTKIKDEQRKWNMDQAAKAADLERRAHFADLDRKAKGQFDIEQVGKMAAAKDKATIQSAQNPELQKIQAQQEAKALSGAEEKARLQQKLKGEFTSQDFAQKEQMLQDKIAAYEAELTAEGKGTPEEIAKKVHDYKMQTLYGVKTQTAKTVSDEDYRKARVASATEVQGLDDTEVLGRLQSFGVQPSADPRGQLTDLMITRFLAPRASATQTPKPDTAPRRSPTVAEARDKIMNLPANEQQAAIDELAQLFPDVARQIVPAANVDTPPVARTPQGYPVTGKTFSGALSRARDWINKRSFED